MNKIFLSDGRWFDYDAACKYLSEQFTSKDSQRDKATGGTFTHQMLFYTQLGNWVLSEWDMRNPEEVQYRVIGESDAFKWLAMQNILPLGVPEDVYLDVVAKMEDLQI